MDFRSGLLGLISYVFRENNVRIKDNHERI